MLPPGDSNCDFWLFGGSGEDAYGNGALLNDMWEFNPYGSMEMDGRKQHS
jgi:hypothetical protein